MAVIERTARRRLAVAAGIGAVAGGTARAETTLDLKLLYYGESDDRTEVVNPDLLLQHDVGDKGLFTLQLAYDTISGASPTGAAPRLDATSSASGGGVAGSFPRVEYEDERKAASVGYQHRFGAHLPSVDLSWSDENDYTSKGLSLVDEVRLPGGLTTIRFGAGVLRDEVTPVIDNRRLDKDTLSGSIGLTRVLGTRDLFDAAFSLTEMDGFLTDPYKVVTVGGGEVPEIRPDSRSRKALVFKYGHYFLSRSALKTTYRYYWDDWSVSAHTLEALWDVRYRSKWILSPRLRYYNQGSAEFFALEFPEEQRYMSSDYRLSAFWSWLAGFGVRYEFTDAFALDIAASYEDQEGEDRIKPQPPPVVAPFGRLAEDEAEDGEKGVEAVSAADLQIVTVTVGFSWRF